MKNPFRKRKTVETPEPEKPEVRLCSTCEHYHPHFLNLTIDGRGWGECWAPENLKTDYETGNAVQDFKYAATVREFADFCGPRGRWWTPKKVTGEQ